MSIHGLGDLVPVAIVVLFVISAIRRQLARANAQAAEYAAARAPDEDTAARAPRDYTAPGGRANTPPPWAPLEYTAGRAPVVPGPPAPVPLRRQAPSLAAWGDRLGPAPATRVPVPVARMPAPAARMPAPAARMPAPAARLAVPGARVPGPAGVPGPGARMPAPAASAEPLAIEAAGAFPTLDMSLGDAPVFGVAAAVRRPRRGIGGGPPLGSAGWGANAIVALEVLGPPVSLRSGATLGAPHAF